MIKYKKNTTKLFSIFSDFYIDPEGPRGHPGGSGADFGGGKQEFFSCRHVKHMGCEVRKHPGGSGADFGGGKQMFFSCRHVETCPSFIFQTHLCRDSF